MRALVTGGGGYIGRHVVRQLLDRGDDVRVLGRRSYPEVEAWGARGVQSDLAVDDPDLPRHLEGVDTVFHVAALPPYHAPYAAFEAANVGGTRRILAACRAAGVPRLVFTSTPSATFDGTDAEGITEAQAPYPARFLTPYAQTKAEAEQLVLAANSPELATTALRPHLVYGPDEPHMLPRIVQRNRAGRLRVIGDGTNRVGLTYVDTAAAAHLQAANALAAGSANAGRAYFVTDEEPVALWPWINQFLEAIGEAPVRGSIGLGAARTVGAVCEALWAVLPLGGEPPMTRFVATNLATSHWYDLSAAKADFRFTPTLSGAEGLARTVAWFRAHPVA